MTTYTQCIQQTQQHLFVYTTWINVDILIHKITFLHTYITDLL